MKVAIAINSLTSGGAERVAITLANYWVEKGWDICFITLAGSASDVYRLDSRIKRLALNQENTSVNPLSAVINNLKRITTIRKALNNDAPDIALGSMPTCNILVGLACAGNRIIAIGSEQNHPPRQLLRTPWKWLRSHTYPKLRALSAPNHESGRWIEEHVGVQRMAVIPNPITYPIPDSNHRLEPKAVINDLGGEYLLLAVGRLVYQKGFDSLLNAFSALHELHPKWRLVILGEGELRNNLEYQRQSLGLDDVVAMPGIAGNIGDMVSNDLYVMPSRWEGFGNTLAEALAYGVPAVDVSGDAGSRGIVRHEVDGLAVPRDDCIALAAALDRLMKSPRGRGEFSSRAIEARERFATKKYPECGSNYFKR